MNSQLNFYALTSIQAGIYICVSSIMAGYILYEIAGFKGALLSLCFGSFILWGLGLVFAKLAIVSRKILIEIVTDYLGQEGAKVCGITFAISLIGWFAIQLEIMARSISTVYPFLPLLSIKIILGFFITTNVAKGMGWIARFAAVSVPFLILMMIYVLWCVHDPLMKIPEVSWNLNGVPIIIAFSLAGIIDAPTYFSASRTPKDAYIATTIVYLLILPFMAFIGFCLAFYTGINDFVLSIINIGGKSWRVLAILFIILAGWTTNNGNLYSASVCLAPNFSINYATRTYLLGIIGIIFASVGVLERFTEVLDVMSIPMAALGAALLGLFLKDHLTYCSLSSTERRLYLSFVGCGVLVGIFSQFKWISFLGYSFMDSFVTTLLVVFVYEGLKKWKHKLI